MELQTLLLTRFNIRFLKGYTYNLDNQWLESRFELFEQFCLPSVEAQTNKDFKWILFFDKSTPLEYKHKAENYKKRLENLEIVYLSSDDIDPDREVPTMPENYDVDYISAIKPFSDQSEYLLTIRFDNDDAIESTFIDEMRKKAIEVLQSGNVKKLPVILNTKLGYQLFLKTKNIFKIGYKNNHYIGMLSSKVDFRIIFECHHSELDRYYPHFPVEHHKPMWVEVVSGTNVTNSFNYTKYQHPVRKIEGNYGFDLLKYDGFLRNCVYWCYYVVCSYRKFPNFVRYCLGGVCRRVKRIFIFKEGK